MRLLLQGGTGEFSFREFLDDEIPPYAILSHTWLAAQDGEEPTYEDVINGTGKGKLGYEKIQFCGEQARQDGLQYFWVDTCCINKANYVELQHAINSMFRWYRNATRCYVYLSDVLSTNTKSNPGSWDSNFWKSRWFTRGWTLQELLAPRSVEFFSCERERLGDKNSLKQQIQAITGIPTLALQGACLSQFSVDERYSWMERRQTTLEVDRVYALLGVLDVKLPLFKDTEAATAFRRLQEVIDKREKCIQDLRVTNPRDDKKRIEDTKGGLLEDSYRWIIGNDQFKRWRSDQLSPLLWIKGDPGKGKTMLLCGIINELSKSTFDTTLLSYFFCQATDSRINNAIAVLRGLIYMLVSQQPSLISHIQKRYNDAGKVLFEDTNAWIALSEIFTNMLQDSSLNSTYLIVDALDECVTGLPALLDLIVHISSVSPHAKWIVSSRNWSSIERYLDTTAHQVRLSLELNERSVAAAIATYIQSKVDWLAERNKYNSDTRQAVQNYLSLNANGTFLWVALVCKELSKVPGWKAKKKVTAFPPELDPFYRRMMDQIRGVDDAEDAELCTHILAVVSAVYQPISLDELSSLVDMPDGVTGEYEALSEIIGLCGSFLTLREHTISFVHQSAKDFLIKEVYNEIYPFGIEAIHYTIFSRSLQAMSKTLQRDIYSLRAPGTFIDQVKVPNPDPLVAAQYPCLYWVEHLFDCNRESSSNALGDSGLVDSFLRHSYLFWLEALSLTRNVSSGIIMIRKLENWLQSTENPNLFAFIHDAMRFALYNRLVIEQAPLQLYCSALIFAPENSVIRATFEMYIPAWIQIKPKVQAYWTAALQTLEGHSNYVMSVAFSPDGKQVVSGSDDDTVRLWDAVTGAPLQTLKGHSYQVTSVAFSPDGKQVVSSSYDKTVRLWDTISGAPLQTLEGHSDCVTSVAFSPNSKQVISGSYDKTLRLWDAITGVQLQTLESHSDWVRSVAFSPNGKQVVSSSDDKTVRLWDVMTGALLQTLEGHSSSVMSVAFSPDGNQVVSSSHDDTVRLWDATTGAPLQTLKGHSNWVTSVAFSPNGKQVISSSDDKTVRLWDVATGALLQTLEGHSDSVTSIAFSPDGKQVASGSHDKTVRFLDATIGAPLQTLEGHSNWVSSVAFSPDGKQIVSGSYDRTVRLWDALTGAPLRTLEGHSNWVSSVAFSPDGKQIVSGSHDKRVRLWDAVIGAPLQTLKGHSDWVTSVAFSPDGKQVISSSDDKTVRLWNVATGALLQTLEGHSDSVTSMAFSPDGKAVNTLLVFNDWVEEEDMRILWLPPDYRLPSCTAVWNRKLVLGYRSGRLSLLGFQDGLKVL